MKTSKKFPVLGAFIILACITLPQIAQAVVPPPDGGYPGFNTAEGANALKNLTTGVANSAVGWFSLFSNEEGNFNTATGAGTLLFNVGEQNTAVGAAALLFNTDGAANTAVGTAALLNNTTGGGNTANGRNALFSNIDGLFNTAVGQGALFANTSGEENTAVGYAALGNNPPDNANTAIGSFALLNTTSTENTGVGTNVLINNTTGGGNTAVGFGALFSSTGNGNIAIGDNAGGAVDTADSVICIGHIGADVSNTTWINNIFGVTTISGNTAPVIVSNTGQLGTLSSSRRFKHDIKPIDKASEAILALKPVAFHYKGDNSNTAQFGLIAEEVAEVDPDLVVHDQKGDIYSVRYEAVNAMLLNEFLKEHRKVQRLEAALDALNECLKEQEAKIEKVSGQIESNRSRPQVAVSNH